jgi:hypothetical protein
MQLTINSVYQSSEGDNVNHKFTCFVSYKQLTYIAVVKSQDAVKTLSRISAAAFSELLSTQFITQRACSQNLQLKDTLINIMDRQAADL